MLEQVEQEEEYLSSGVMTVSLRSCRSSTERAPVVGEACSHTPSLWGGAEAQSEAGWSGGTWV